MNQQIQIIQESIKRLDNMIQLAIKDENFDRQKLDEMQKQKTQYSLELSRLFKIQWEETYERLDYGDER
jgi:hypothetical protein